MYMHVFDTFYDHFHAIDRETPIDTDTDNVYVGIYGARK